jgi:phospholipid/cholesterol/gamma-HCH transport system permease protein
MSAEAAAAPDSAWLQSDADEGTLRLRAGGGWTIGHLVRLDEARRRLIEGLDRPQGAATIDLADLGELDSAGALVLHQLEQQLGAAGLEVGIERAKPRHDRLLAEIRRAAIAPPPAVVTPHPALHILSELGRCMIEALVEGCRLLSFFGQTMLTFMRVMLRPAKLRLTSLTHHLEQTCLNALPIVGLIAFLIGVVMAYQGADQLRRFGAEIFTVDLLGVSILREIGILLTAIVVAGRSGSAFTAEIGAMSVNQEIDALRSLGLDPVEVLVLPRLLALMIALPLLVFVADILGLIGGGLMAWTVLDISPGRFLTQLDSAIGPATFWVGMVKAPVFAFLIAMVGCYQGLQVSGSADSVGKQTTKSVVVGIFLVIVFDALFSIMFSYLGL